MRSKQAAKNMIANIILQITVFLAGIALPRFFLEEYGSTINGMVTSVNQFLVYLGLAEAGVGVASTVALYSPLAKEDQREVNAILSATKQFYYRSSYIFGALVMVFVLVYPYLITEQLSAGMVRMMILILASSTLVDYLLLGKYKVLLTANQRGYVVAYVQAVGTVLNVVVNILLIYQHANPLLVKAAATFIYILRFFVIRWYVRKNYKEVSFKETPKMEGLTQRGAALLHQIVGVIVNNTAVVLITICMGSRSLVEVSVYSIYNLIVVAINQVFTSFSNGLTAGFGEVISKDEKEVLKKSFSNYEYIYMIVVFCAFVCTGVLLIPFVMIYTSNVSDAVYVRYMAAGMFTVIILLQNIRIPALTIISAAGHFKETRYQAILEASINIVVSFVFIWKLGMNGVLLGTICSYGYRSIDIILYNRKYLVEGSGKTSMKRIIRNLIVSLIIMGVCFLFVPQEMESFLTWAVFAVVVAMISLIALVIINYVCEPEEFKSMWQRVKSLKR